MLFRPGFGAFAFDLDAVVDAVLFFTVEVAAEDGAFGAAVAGVAAFGVVQSEFLDFRFGDLDYGRGWCGCWRGGGFGGGLLYGARLLAARGIPPWFGGLGGMVGGGGNGPLCGARLLAARGVPPLVAGEVFA